MRIYDYDRKTANTTLSKQQDCIDIEYLPPLPSPPPPPPPSPIRRWKWKHTAYALAALSLMQFLLLISWSRHYHLNRHLNTYETGFETELDAAKPHIRLEELVFESSIRATEDGTLVRVERPGGRRYTGKYPPEEVNAAWEGLIGEGMDLDVDGGGDGGFGVVGMQYSLHCLDVLRRRVVLDGGVRWDLLPAGLEEMRIDHCIDQLRQSIMCFGDLTPVAMRPVVYQGEDGRQRRVVLGDTGQRHTCRKHEDIQGWRRTRSGPTAA